MWFVSVRVCMHGCVCVCVYGTMHTWYGKHGRHRYGT